MFRLRVTLWSISRSGNRPKCAGSSERRRCLLGTGRIGNGHCGVFFFAGFGVIERLGASERFLVIVR